MQRPLTCTASTATPPWTQLQPPKRTATPRHNPVVAFCCCKPHLDLVAAAQACPATRTCAASKARPGPATVWCEASALRAAMTKRQPLPATTKRCRSSRCMQKPSCCEAWRKWTTPPIHPHAPLLSPVHAIENALCWVFGTRAIIPAMPRNASSSWLAQTWIEL